MKRLLMIALFVAITISLAGWGAVPNNTANSSGQVIGNTSEVLLPISPSAALSRHYMDVGRLFIDAGFGNIETDEVYDLPAGASSETIIFVNGQKIAEEAQIPSDSKISIIGHFPVPEFATTINIDFEPNLIFSKYNVVVTLNDSTLGTLPHGENGSYKVMLPAGNYDLIFSSEEDSDVFGSVTLTVNYNTTAHYRISCNRNTINVEEKDVSQSIGDNYLLIPFSSSHYLRKDYQTVVDELIAQGFSRVTAKETTDCFWSPDAVDSVVGIDFGGETEFKPDTLFDKTTEVTVYYHVADFAFTKDSISITEKETFSLDYTMNSGDTIGSINFEIDDPNILRRNEDGSFTALSHGTATIIASSGSHTYSKCTVEVEELIIPIEKIVFSSSDIEVSVGSTFKLGYTIVPENANYKDNIRIETSNDLIELVEGNTLYAREKGDSAISIYQDDRLIGSCVVHASYIEIQEVTLGNAPKEVFIGDTVELPFSLTPENATNKGIRVTSTNPRAAEVSFDERGASLVKIVGKAVGNATIRITTPTGRSYNHTITVKEVIPTEIVLTNSNPTQRIEVGTPIALNVTWQPENTSVKDLSWTSSNIRVVRVDRAGNLEAVGVGTADITARHKSGVTAKISITVEPTVVTKVEITSNRDEAKKFCIGDNFTIAASVFPEKATNKTVTFSSSDESVVKVSNRGVVSAVGVGTATITTASPDGAKQTIPVTVSPAPQKFRINWTANILSNDSVGGSWSKAFYVNGKSFNNGNTIVLDPDSSFSVEFDVTENDTKPDRGFYSEVIKYSDDLCKNGYTISTSVYVKENGGRYSGHYAIWALTIKITPVR